MTVYVCWLYFSSSVPYVTAELLKDSIPSLTVNFGQSTSASQK